MEQFVVRTLLFDFYGELLTEHQRQIYSDVVLNDYSVSEVARIAGVSRQGVHDLIRRCDRILEDYEQKLGLVEKFMAVREKVRRIQTLADEISAGTDLHETGGKKAGADAPGTGGSSTGENARKADEIRTLSASILDEL